MRVLLDTNVALDFTLQRQPWYIEAHAIFLAQEQERIHCALSALSICNIYYVMRRFLGRDAALNKVGDFLRAFEVLPIDAVILKSAGARSGNDFEDDIQQTIAVHAKVDAIVTRDPRGFRNSSVPAISPAELMKQLAT